MRTDIEFPTDDGLTLRGWLTTPDGEGPHPTVVVVHGFSAVKEQTLDRFADTLAAAGLASLVYDNRNLGASDGEVRQDIDPVAQLRDMRTAITFAESRPEVAAGRIGIWGSSYSGAHVLQVAAVDRRVRAVVSQVPLVSGWRNVQRWNGTEGFRALQQLLDDEHRTRLRTGGIATIPVAAATPGEPCAVPGVETYEYFTKVAPADGWRNEVTVRSLGKILDYDVTCWVERISPTPLLVITTDDDVAAPTPEVLAAYELAREPKELLMVRGHHYTVYDEHLERCSRAAAEFYGEHL
jgi:uncharacterized protein